jgi:hypothetical protein
MRAEYDFSKAKRGAILPTKEKARIRADSSLGAIDPPVSLVSRDAQI